MNYSQEEFLALMLAVEAEGGEHLDETCLPKVIWHKIPKRRKKRGFALARCNQEALFHVPYKPENPGPADEVGLVKVCAVDDDMGKWPRFQHIYDEVDDEQDRD